MSLPRFVVLKSNYNNKYLRYIHEDVQVHGFLQFSGEEVVSPYAKFEVEVANSGHGHVHIRCCYNNKYWVRRRPQEPDEADKQWIVAGADEPEEGPSKWSCTLFKPIDVDADAKTVRFSHVRLGHYACLGRNDAPFDSCLFASLENPIKDSCDVFTIIDWESLLIMPKHVAFKGDNGQYLSARWIQGHHYLQFASNDVGDPTVGNEIFTTHDGSIRVKSNYFGKFWRRSPNWIWFLCKKNWIWADSDDTTNNNFGTLFQPIKVDNNVIALRNLDNNNFCKRLTTEGKTSCLNAGVSAISREARIEVEELVISRQIRNVNFRLLDARNYRQRVRTMTTQVAYNGSQVPNNVELKLSYTETKSNTWSSSVSLKLGVKTNFKADVPFIVKGKIEILADFGATYQWGESKTTSTAMETVYKVTVPPKTMVEVSARAIEGSCDVPFSYTQCDTLINGQQVTYNMEDGIYTSISFLNVRYETNQENL
ncbi:hypothetical protein QN277_009878 [Acacia crassicarpa]|uniref:Agglutinin domain-containing protein n=1 Tax=Acacia crassicarpa TaxID=499986 RepID=A0AAE1MCA5_9FABA|nr:hypothetical protein QN277_009878 [Acacia crassicarpa]